MIKMYLDRTHFGMPALSDHNAVFGCNDKGRKTSKARQAQQKYDLKRYSPASLTRSVSTRYHSSAVINAVLKE